LAPSVQGFLPYSIDMILETERLVLDTWQISDWIALRPIATDVEVMRYITGGVPWTDERIQSFVARQVQLFSERGFCRWKMLLIKAHSGNDRLLRCGLLA
jgi:RimJ/RimL family protein N-acetyltransferase